MGISTAMCSVAQHSTYVVGSRMMNRAILGEKRRVHNRELIRKRQTETKAGETALWVKCFTTLDKILSLICRTHIKKPGMTVYVCNLSPGEAETNGFL